MDVYVYGVVGTCREWVLQAYIDGVVDGYVDEVKSLLTQSC